MPPTLVIGQERRTHPLIWCAAILCTILTIIVIIIGIVIFIANQVIHPKMPFVSVSYAHLNAFEYDQAGVLNTGLTIIINAENDNPRAHANFYNFSYSINFQGIRVANLVNLPFDLGKNKSRGFRYVFDSDSIPLNPYQSEVVDLSLKKGRIVFYLVGHTRTRWRIGFLRSVKFWLRLDCRLQFQWPGGNSVDSRCTSKTT